MKKLLFLVLILLVGAGAFYFARPDKPPVSEPSRTIQAAVPPEEAAPEIRYPLPDVPTGDTLAERPLERPASLDASDEAMARLLTRLFGEPALALFKPDNLIRRVAVSVDNLPREQVPPRLLPVQPLTGPLRVSGEDTEIYLSADNYPRYSHYVDMLTALDSTAAVEQYVRLYPLFQQAFAELGYPKAYFNDRLIEVIDGLLAVPAVDGPIKLVRPSVMYKFADPTLEALPAGQKLLIRMGPDNADRVRAKLREIRVALLAQVAAGTPPSS